MSESENDSEYVISDEAESEPEKKKKSRGALITLNEGDYRCKRCGMGFKTKSVAYKHTRSCKGEKKMKKTPLNKCMWCGLEFRNRGNLASHAFHIHGDTSYKALSSVTHETFACQVCNKTYKTTTQLRYHIREVHFNLRAKIPYAEFKKVNQIWFEKVQNSNKIMEIRKTGQNTLIMRTLDENTGIKVNEVDPKVVDVSHMYPTQKSMRVMCEQCDRTILKRDMKKHVEERHLNKKRHMCNNCNRTFKRSYLYLQHNCSRTKRLKGVQHNKRNDTEIRISNVESLSISLG